MSLCPAYPLLGFLVGYRILVPSGGHLEGLLSPEARLLSHPCLPESWPHSETGVGATGHVSDHFPRVMHTYSYTFKIIHTHTHRHENTALSKVTGACRFPTDLFSWSHHKHSPCSVRLRQPQLCCFLDPGYSGSLRFTQTLGTVVPGGHWVRGRAVGFVALHLLYSLGSMG
jgi:hypothetical protein